MNATTVAVDLAKSVFQLAVADGHWRVVETQRLTRAQFERWFATRDVCPVIMEACGSAYHWARCLNGLGIGVKLLPARYIRASVKRNKTDAEDAAASLEASCASDIRPVRIKSVEQQAPLAQPCRQFRALVCLQLLRWWQPHRVMSATSRMRATLARIGYATLRDKEPFGKQAVRLGEKISRASLVMPA